MAASFPLQVEVSSKSIEIFSSNLSTSFYQKRINSPNITTEKSTQVADSFFYSLQQEKVKITSFPSSSFPQKYSRSPSLSPNDSASLQLDSNHSFSPSPLKERSEQEKIAKLHQNAYAFAMRLLDWDPFSYPLSLVEEKLTLLLQKSTNTQKKQEILFCHACLLYGKKKKRSQELIREWFIEKLFSLIRKSNRENAERDLFREIATFFTDYPDFQNMLAQSIRNYYFPNQSALYCAYLWFPSNETKSLQAIQKWLNLNSPITKEKFKIVFRFYSNFPSPPHHLLLSFLHLQLATKVASEKVYTFHLQTALDFYQKTNIDYIYQRCSLLFYRLAEQAKVEANYLYLVKSSPNPLKALSLIKSLHSYLEKKNITLYTFPGAVQFGKRELDLLEKRYQKLLQPDSRYITLNKSFFSLLGYSK